jgi:hypothetical protein
MKIFSPSYKLSEGYNSDKLNKWASMLVKIRASTAAADDVLLCKEFAEQSGLQTVDLRFRPSCLNVTRMSMWMSLLSEIRAHDAGTMFDPPPVLFDPQPKLFGVVPVFRPRVSSLFGPVPAVPASSLFGPDPVLSLFGPAPTPPSSPVATSPVATPPASPQATSRRTATVDIGNFKAVVRCVDGRMTVEMEHN